MVTNTDKGTEVHVPPQNVFNFVSRARQELSRAERYCLFLSMVLIDMNELNRALVNRQTAEKIDFDSLCRDIEKNLKDSLRASDVIAQCDKNRIGLLLMETSRSGLDVVKRRVHNFVRDYLRAALRLPFDPDVNVRDASFPEEPEQFSELTQYMDLQGSALPIQSN